MRTLQSGKAPTTHLPNGASFSSLRSRRAVIQGGITAALVQLAAAGASQARQEPINKEVDAADSPFIQELLKRSQEKKEQRDKERLDAYYKKNFKALQAPAGFWSIRQAYYLHNIYSFIKAFGG